VHVCWQAAGLCMHVCVCVCACACIHRLSQAGGGPVHAHLEANGLCMHLEVHAQARRLCVSIKALLRLYYEAGLCMHTSLKQLTLYIHYAP
jgi:hypothetical protein